MSAEKFGRYKAEVEEMIERKVILARRCKLKSGETPKRYYYTSYGGLRVIYNDTVKAAKITREVWERSLGGTRQK